MTTFQKKKVTKYINYEILDDADDLVIQLCSFFLLMVLQIHFGHTRHNYFSGPSL